MSGSTQLDNLPPENSLSSKSHSLRLLNTSSDDETNKTSSDDETNKTSSDDETNKTRSDDEANKTGSDDETKKTRSDDETNKTRSDDETNKTRSDDETKKTRSDEETKKTTSRRGQFLDGGWGWVVLFGSFYITTFMNNVTICFGVLFSQKMTQLSASSTDVGIIFSIHSVMWNFGTLLTTSLVNKFGHRSVAFTGCFVASVSFILLAFSNSVTYVLIVYSLIVGISGGIGSTVSFLLIPQYFDRRRGLAMAVMMTGVAFGGIVNPLIIRGLQNEYAFFGGCLVHGAIISNCCVAAALYRPPPIINNNAEMKSLITKGGILPKEDRTSRKSAAGILAKVAAQIFKWISRKVMTLKQLRVVLMGISISTILVGYINFLMLVPFSVESTGHSPMFSAWCISTFSISNTCLRLSMAFISDRSWFNRRAFFIFGAFLAASSTYAFAFFSSSTYMMTAAMISAGSGIGLYMSLFHVNLVDVLGMKLYLEVIGVNSVIRAITYAVVGPVLGLLRDLSGSYSLSICACASLQLCSALLLLPLPLAVSRDKKLLLKRQENAGKE